MMLLTLMDVLNELNYFHKEQLIDFVKLLEIRGCFDGENKSKFISDKIAQEYLGKPVKDVFAPFAQTLLAENKKNNENKDLSQEQKQSLDKERAVIEKIFQGQTLEDGVACLQQATQKRFLRQSFTSETISANTDGNNAVKRWEHSDKIDLSEEATAEQKELLKIFETFHLTSTVPFPKKVPDAIVIHGAPEMHARERIHFIPSDYAGPIFYLTNARGLFIYEPSFAAVLAAWFEDPSLEAKIRQTLNLYKANEYSWLNKIDDVEKKTNKKVEELKQAILNAINKENWPSGKGWYYKDPEAFERAAKVENRITLADWPTVMDMVEHLMIANRKEANQSCDFTLQPIYAFVPPGKDGISRVANTGDTLKAWYEKYGEQYINDKHLTAFISSNSEGLHNVGYQDAVLRMILAEKGKDIQTLNDYVMTVGPGNKKISLYNAFDALAKTLYEVITGWKAEQAKKASLLITMTGGNQATPHISKFGLFSQPTVAEQMIADEKENKNDIIAPPNAKGVNSKF
jgi:hypothetical protein